MKNNVYLMLNFDNRIALTKKLISVKPKPIEQIVSPFRGNSISD